MHVNLRQAYDENKSKLQSAEYGSTEAHQMLSESSDVVKALQKKSRDSETEVAELKHANQTVRMPSMHAHARPCFFHFSALRATCHSHVKCFQVVFDSTFVTRRLPHRITVTCPRISSLTVARHPCSSGRVMDFNNSGCWLVLRCTATRVHGMQNTKLPCHS